MIIINFIQANFLIELMFVFLPFFGGFLSYIFRRYLGTKGVIIVNIQSLLFSVVFVLIALINNLYSINYKAKVIILSFPWIEVNNLNVEWTFLIDGVSLLMSALIILITTLVELYSVDYMKDDINQGKFFMLLSFFAFFMLVFVTSGNALQMFIGWEGIGVISFLLINFWNTRLEANRGALKAILFNKVGDIGFYIFLVLLFYFFKTLDIVLIQELTEYYAKNTLHVFELLRLPKIIYYGNYEDALPWINLIFEFPTGWNHINIIHWLECFDRDFKFTVLEFVGLALFLAAAGKSAQFGLHAWLADAMEGPTPVSSLLHSATMVTAGVFLLIRFNFILHFCPHVLILISIIGGLTAFFAGCCALLQMDIKKVVAYSTLSQLGFMVAACGVEAYNLAFFHLCTHAFFKCSLFLTAGSVIHALVQEQDMRKMGNSFKYVPYTTICMFIGYLGLVGLPFFSGFFSKESILLSYLCDTRYSNNIVLSFLFITTALTCFYSFRTLYHISFGIKRGSAYKAKIAHEAPIFMALALFVLAKFTIFFGFFIQELYVGAGAIYITSTINAFEHIQFFELLHFYEKYLPLFILLLLPIWANIYYKKYFGIVFIYLYTNLIKYFLNNVLNPFIYSILYLKESTWYWTVHYYHILVVSDIKIIIFFCYKLYKVLSLRWYFGSLYKALTLGLYNLSYNIVIKVIDRGYLEIFGAFGLVQLFSKISSKLIKTQTGIIFTYIFIFCCGFFFYIEILSFI